MSAKKDYDFVKYIFEKSYGGNDEHLSNISLRSEILFVFHFEISGKVNNDEQSWNIPLISVTSYVFHFEILGKKDNDEHPLNI